MTDYRIQGDTGGWEVVIGLEVHAQITSNAKLFSGASTAFGAEPDTQVSLVGAVMSVPGGLDSQGLPLGLHLIGRESGEQIVLNAGRAIEERAGFTARAEKWW